MTPKKRGIIKCNIDKLLLDELIWEIYLCFKTKPDVKTPINMFSLTCDEQGYWKIEVTDDWHKWLENGIEMKYRYPTPETACREFLKFLIKNKIDVKELQSKEK